MASRQASQRSHSRRRLGAAAARRVLPAAWRHRVRSVLQYPETLRLVADARSFRAFRRLERPSARWAEGELAEVRLRALGGRSLSLRPGTDDNWVVRSAFLSGFHLAPEELDESSVASVLDLGASIGATTAHFAHRYPNARIVAVELDGATAAVCRRNLVAWREQCRVVEGAVWSTCAPLVYELAGSSSQAHRVVTAPGPATAPTVGLPIEDLIGREAVDYIKMDIEGAEREVLRVNTSWASRVRAIKVEVHPPYTVDDCATDLRALGFSTRIDKRHWACVVGVKEP